MIQHRAQPSQIGDFGHKCPATLLCRLNRVGLQPVLPDPLGIGEGRLHRTDTGSAHFGGFLDNKIRAGLLDRCKQQPKVRRHLQWFCLLATNQNAAAFSGLKHLCRILPSDTVKKLHHSPDAQSHYPEQVVRMVAIERNRLPLPQRVIYIKPNNGCHGADFMTDTGQRPEQNGPDQGQVADAVKGNWVDTLAPVWTRPYLRLSRADRPIGTWLLLLPCWWGLMLAILHTGTATLYDAWIGLGCAIGAFLMRGAGCTWNDITDREIDASVARTKSRPIPAGQVTLKGATTWMIIQALIAFAILLTFPPAAIFMGVAALAPVAIYPFAKRFTWWPQAFLGIAYNWGALLAWAAHTGSLDWPPVLLYFAGIAWTLFYDTIYAHQDTEDDALIGVKSTARLFADNSPKWLRSFLMATVMLMGLAVLLAILPNGNPLQLALALAAPWAMGWHLAWQLRRFDADDNEGLMNIFRSNRDAGLLPVLFFALCLLV